MAIFNLFKDYKPRRTFNYKPIYYDEDKENFEERKKRIEQEVALSKGLNVTYRSNLQKGFLTEKRKTSSNKVSYMLFVAALAVVVIYCFC
ncbi:MAG: hypothetical protein IK005_00475 [Paludibacteraceae bacterium]|nr:hypothetical protein [Paludibacteraceae bacterium]MBR4838932.1 hypothetical protein [Paludibacteraceae bacterium]